MINIEKLKKIGYGDSISLKCNINRTNLTYLQNSILSEIDEMEANNKYITYFLIDIFVSDLENCTDKKIGFIRGCFIKPEAYMDDSNFYNTCDVESAELEEIASLLVNEDGYMAGKYANSSDCICYISDFYIYKKFRECGIGSYILNQLNHILRYYAMEFITKIILLPQPRVINNQRHTQNLSDKNKKKEIALSKLLKDYYRKNGFKEIKNSKYVIKNIL